MPVVKVSVTAVPSLPPALEATPELPAGIVNVTLVCCQNPAVGTNVAVSPLTLQLPATFGLSVGIGELGLSGLENTTLIAAPPLTSVAPSAGVTEPTCS